MINVQHVDFISGVRSTYYSDDKTVTPYMSYGMIEIVSDTHPPGPLLSFPDAIRVNEYIHQAATQLQFSESFTTHIITIEAGMLPTCNNHPAKSFANSLQKDILEILF